MNAPFDADADDLAALIAETPLCWIVPNGAPDAALLMPVVLERDEQGVPRSLLGHLPRRAPATTALEHDGAASFLWLGPHGYISPAAAGRADWAPTWNFASARIIGRIALDAALTDAALDVLVERMEGPNGWTTASLGARYHELAARIVGFRAVIDRVAPRFKLAQDEIPQARDSIMAACKGTPLGRWMRHFAR